MTGCLDLMPALVDRDIWLVQGSSADALERLLGLTERFGYWLDKVRPESEGTHDGPGELIALVQGLLSGKLFVGDIDAVRAWQRLAADLESGECVVIRKDGQMSSGDIEGWTRILSEKFGGGDAW